MKPGIIITIIGSVAFIAIMLVVKEGAKAAYDSFGGAIVGTALVVFVVSGLIYDRWSKRPPTS